MEYRYLYTCVPSSAVKNSQATGSFHLPMGGLFLHRVQSQFGRKKVNMIHPSLRICDPGQLVYDRLAVIW